jgi:PAS domain S-box-containing protein
MMEFFNQLLSRDFTPHGFCYLWDPRIVWLHVISDGLITLSYYCIPIILVYFIRKNRDLPFNRIFWMFGGFVLACGTTHLMEIWNIWHGSYLLAGVLKGITAAVSVITAAMLIPLVPKVISLPGRMDLQGREITERAQAEEALKESLAASEHALKELADQKFALDQHAIVAVTDVHGTITYVNEKFCAISQYPQEELIGRNHRILNSGYHSKDFFQQMYHTIANGKVWHGEIKNRAKDGSIYWVDTTIVPSMSAEGKPRQYVAIRADITERKRAEEALQESLSTSETALKELADQKFALDQHAIVAVTDVQGTINYVNDKFCAISGFSREELIGQNHRILNSGHHPKEFFQQMYHTIANGKVWHGEIKNRAKDGSIYWVDTTIVPFIGAEGKPRQYVAIRADITERKRVEEVRERLAAVVESSDDAIISKTLDGTITAWNSGAEKLFGYSSSQALGKSMRMLVPPERADEESDILARIGRGESVEHFETVRVRKDGRRIDVSATISPTRDSSGTVVGASKIARDITERKRAEEAVKGSLAASEAAVKELADQKFALDQHAIVAVTDVQGTITYVNEKFCGISKYSRDELIGHNHRILNSGHHPKEFFQQMYHTIANGKVWHGEIKNRAKDGSIYWVDTTIVPTLSTEGKPRQYVAIRADITERKQAEEVLQEQAQVLDSAQVFVRDMQSRVVSWPLGAERLYGFKSDEALGTVSHELFHTKFPEPVEVIEKKLLETGVWEGELIHRRRDGSTIVVSSAWVLHRDSQGRPARILETNIDITARKQAEASLQESLATREVALKELADQKFALDQHAIVAVTDVQGTITYVNDKFCVISQYSEDELISQNHRILNSGHHPKEFFQQMYHTIANGRVWHGEIKNRAKDGSIYWVDTTIVPFVGADGKPRQYVAIRADITERKLAADALAAQAVELSRSQQALEAQSLMLQSVLDSMAEGLVAADEQGKFLIWNRAAERIVGYGPADISTPEWSAHYGNYLPDEVTLFPTEQLPLVRAIHGEASTAEIFLRSPKVSQGAWIEASGSPLRGKDGVVHGGVVAFRDITQRRADEREILKLNNELEQRVAERTAQLEAANKELEAFSYSVSHDLRAPLRHIGGFSKMLIEEFGPTLDPAAQHYVERIQLGTQRMGLLVDELLNLARIGRHSLNRYAVRLNVIVAEVISILEPESEGRQVEWVIADLPALECDPVLVRQVFQNLLANALKFTRPRARAIIEVSHIENERDGQPVLMVRDNGIGFDMKYVDKLFGVFQRLHRMEDFEGTGIGLATVQRIVQKHGGRVWTEGKLDKGAAFYFTLGAEKQTELKSNEATAGGQS